MSTGRFTPTDRALLVAGIFAAALIITGGPGCGRKEVPVAGHLAVPELTHEIETAETGHGAEPSRLQVVGDTLFVAYNGESHLDAYDLDLAYLRTIPLTAPETIMPTAFAVTDTSIVVCDHGRGIIALFDRDGRYRESFGTLPDGTSRLRPVALAVHRGIAYVADMEQRRVLAVSLNDAEGVTERGELVLSIPGISAPPLGFPSAVMVTPDGRLLVGDALAGVIEVFTCDGQAIYAFDAVPGLEKLAPQGFAGDTIRDPALTIENSFDPSGLPRQGRYHVLDGYNGVVHMFNPAGRYLGSYPEDGRLAGPAGIAADAAGGRIFVADTRGGRILVFRVKGE